MSVTAGSRWGASISGWHGSGWPPRDRDARAIAAVHVASWRSAYAGLVPAATLDGLNVDARARQWACWLTDPKASSVVLVVTEPQVCAGSARSARRVTRNPRYLSSSRSTRSTCIRSTGVGASGALHDTAWLMIDKNGT